MKKSDTFFTGLFLFSMFFGAGNLMFPPFLGDQSGTSYWEAIAGFVTTGVGLPVIVLVAVAMTKGGTQELASRVSPTFATIFIVVVYLSIGPFLAIPRNATVAYEMALKPFAGALGESAWLLLAFTAVFFFVTCFVSLNLQKMAELMGRIVTPLLLVAIITLCIAGFMNLGSNSVAPTEEYQAGAYFKGFIEGYNTLDALASLGYGMVIMAAIKRISGSDPKRLTQQTIKAGLIAGVILAAVYVALGVIGTQMSGGTFENGTEILVAAGSTLFGPAGTLLIGFIFLAACFTTVVGLTTACSQYFSELMPKLSYRNASIAVSLISFTVSNLGLNQILSFSAPILLATYPITIVITALAFLNRYLNSSKKVYGIAVLFTAIPAIFDGLKAFPFDIGMGAIEPVFAILPLYAAGFGWVVPSIIGTLIGLIWEKTTPKKTVKNSVEAAQ